MPEPIRICFLADRHDLYDDRIYWKMAVKLHACGFEVFYLLLGNKNQEGMTREGIRFQMFKLKRYSKNRFLNFVLKRMNPFNNYRKLFQAARELRADIYHFHDLWINRIGPDLKKLPHHPVVFYDAREPYAEDFISRSSPGSFSNGIVKIFAHYTDKWEKSQALNYDMVIANENNVRQKFARVLGADKTATLYNYSDLHCGESIDYEEKLYDLIYCGSISKIRGVFDMVDAISIAKTKRPDIKAVFVGSFYPPQLKAELNSFLKSNGLENNIELVEQVPHEKVGRYYENSRLGFILFNRVSTFELSMPIKLFEYMSFGLPVIGNNFGHIREYILKDQSGITVDASNHMHVAEAVIQLLNNRILYDEISLRCKSIADKNYRWEYEFERLLGFYYKALDEG